MSLRCKVKILGLDTIPASDGSIISTAVINDYLNSQKFKEDLAGHRLLGSLTHKCRNAASLYDCDKAKAVQNTQGKDDSLIDISIPQSSPTHYLEDAYIQDGWLWGTIRILEEDGLDDGAIQNIRRLRGLLKQGVHPGVSAVKNNPTTMAAVKLY